MKILYKSITEDTQITATDCYLVGAEMTNDSCDGLIIYDQTSNAKTAARKVIGLEKTRNKSLMFPLPGILCDGLYADIDGGTGTIYYYF